MKKKILLISLLSGFVFIASLTMVFLLFSKPTNITNDPNASSSSESSSTETQIIESPFEKIMGRSSSACIEISPNPKSLFINDLASNYSKSSKCSPVPINIIGLSVAETK